MTLYAFLLSVHVIAAILGLGQVTALALLASSLAARLSVGPETWRLLQLLVRGTTVGLIVMMVTGVLIEWSLSGPYHETWWFRASFLGLLVVAALHARTRAALRTREALGEQTTMRGLARRAWMMSAVIAAIAVLMELKPA